MTLNYGFCKATTAIANHLLLSNSIVTELWQEVDNVIISRGHIYHDIQYRILILEDIENGPIQKSIMLSTKTFFYNAMKEKSKTTISWVKSEFKMFIMKQCTATVSNVEL